MSVAYLVVLAAAAASTPDDLSVIAMHNFGACVVARTPQGARSVLERDFRTPEYGQALGRLARGHGRCAPGARLKFNGVLFAGALAEALVEEEVLPTELPKHLAYNPARPAIPARSAMEAMALCTALHAPQETSQLLQTEPASREEAAAAQALGPRLNACLRTGTVANLNRPALRSILALAAWRIAGKGRQP